MQRRDYDLNADSFATDFVIDFATGFELVLKVVHRVEGSANAMSQRRCRH